MMEGREARERAVFTGQFRLCLSPMRRWMAERKLAMTAMFVANGLDSDGRMDARSLGDGVRPENGSIRRLPSSMAFDDALFSFRPDVIPKKNIVILSAKLGIIVFVGF